MSEETSEVKPRRGRVLRVLLIGILVAGAGAASYERLTRPPEAPPLSEPGAWLAGALPNPAAAPYSELWPQLVVERAALPRSLSHVAAGGRREGASQLHVPFQRSYFRLEPPLETPAGFETPYLQSVYPGPLPPGRPVLTFVGVWTRSTGQPGAVFEVVAYTESPEPQSARWVFGPPRARNLHAGALRARRAAGEVFLPSR